MFGLATLDVETRRLQTKRPAQFPESKDKAGREEHPRERERDSDSDRDRDRHRDRERERASNMSDVKTREGGRKEGRGCIIK